MSYEKEGNPCLSSKRLRDKRPSSPPSKEKLISLESTKNSTKKGGPRPKRKATRRNYGEEEEEEMASEGKDEESMVRGQDSLVPSRVLDTFKIKTNTCKSRKEGETI